MKVFTFRKGEIIAVAVAYNRGQAVKMLAKELEQRGMELSKADPVTELDLEDPKGKVILL